MMSAAAQREDRCLAAPETMKGAVVSEADAKLVKLGFAREILAKPGAPLWRRDETGRSSAVSGRFASMHRPVEVGWFSAPGLPVARVRPTAAELVARVELRRRPIAIIARPIPMVAPRIETISGRIQTSLLIFCARGGRISHRHTASELRQLVEELRTTLADAAEIGKRGVAASDGWVDDETLRLAIPVR